jgi:hypothetical protein
LAEKGLCTKMIIVAISDMMWTWGLMRMKVDSRSFPESICTPESKSIRGRGGHHKLLLFWNPNAAWIQLRFIPVRRS